MRIAIKEVQNWTPEMIYDKIQRLKYQKSVITLDYAAEMEMIDNEIRNLRKAIEKIEEGGD